MASAIVSSMPCSLCGSWDANPSWHRCDTMCVSPEGVAKLRPDIEIRCSRSRDDTYWFFFCDRCKNSRPHIRGVLRNVRIWRSPYCRQNGYITESEEYSYCSSDEESFTLEEDEEYHSIQESAQAVSLKNRAVECFCIRSFTKRLYVNLSAYTEIKLYRTCRQIYLINRARSNWWANMNHNIQMACCNNNNNNSNNNTGSRTQ